MTNVLDIRNEKLPVQTKVSEESRAQIAENLGRALASTYVLYHKTQGYHWNLTGPLFYSAHKLTEEHYEDMAEAIDDIAERMRALGAPAMMGLTQYVSMSVVDDGTDFPETGKALKQLAADHAMIADQMRETVRLAEEANDVFTADLLISRIGFHEEAAWMLNAMIAQ